MIGFQMHNERIELKIPREVQDKVGKKKRNREKQMENMAKSDGFEKKEGDNPTEDNSTTLENIKSSQSDREREREELIIAEHINSQPNDESMDNKKKEEEYSDEFDSEEEDDQTFQNDNVINF